MRHEAAVFKEAELFYRFCVEKGGSGEWNRTIIREWLPRHGSPQGGVFTHMVDFLIGLAFVVIAFGPSVLAAIHHHLSDGRDG